MVEVFKTNVPPFGDHARYIIKELSALFPGCRINFDLNDCDRVLRIEGERIYPSAIIEWLHTRGYACSILE